jgi:hypothetical protein
MENCNAGDNSGDKKKRHQNSTPTGVVKTKIIPANASAKPSRFDLPSTHCVRVQENKHNPTSRTTTSTSAKQEPSPSVRPKQLMRSEPMPFRNTHRKGTVRRLAAKKKNRIAQAGFRANQGTNRYRTTAKNNQQGKGATQGGLTNAQQATQ